MTNECRDSHRCLGPVALGDTAANGPVWRLRKLASAQTAKRHTPAGALLRSPPYRGDCRRFAIGVGFADSFDLMPRDTNGKGSFQKELLMVGSEFARWINPVLKALSELGGSARPREVVELVARNERVADDVLDQINPAGGQRFPQPSPLGTILSR